MPPAKSKKSQELDVKEWFVIIENQQLGPYSLLDLKREARFTPDTLVWRKDFKEWIKARFVPELRILFKDEPDSSIFPISPRTGTVESDLQQSQATLTLQQDPYPFILWILLFLLLIFYTLYRFYHQL